MPSTRTPEGDPINCPICGFPSNVEPSIPPGDCVCPRCGALLWVPAKESKTKSAIRSFVRELQSLVASDDSTTYSAGFLVSGLRRCLAAHGASLWIKPKPRLFRRAKPLLIRSDGHLASSDFACEVIAASTPIVRTESQEHVAYLHLGVPIVRDAGILGVIEIAQRDVREDHAQRGYIRFISQMAEVAAPLAVRLQNG